MAAPHLHVDPWQVREPEVGVDAAQLAVSESLNGTVIRLVAEDTAPDAASLPPEWHERTLELRAGTPDRQACWRLPSGTRLQVRTTRLVSLAERSVCAVRYAVDHLLDGARSGDVSTETRGHTVRTLTAELAEGRAPGWRWSRGGAGCARNDPTWRSSPGCPPPSTARHTT